MDKYVIRGKENSMNRFVQDLEKEEFLATNLQEEKCIVTQKAKTNALETSIKFDRKRSAPIASTSKSNKLKNSETTKKPKFNYLPVPKTISNQKNIKLDNEKDAMRQSGLYKQPLWRPPCLITGTVEFVLKVHKENPELEIIYEVYDVKSDKIAILRTKEYIRNDFPQLGKLINIFNGKHPYEKLIFVRGSAGPVLQGVFYELDHNISFLQGGQNICCVGKFRSNNKMHIFKIKPVPVLPSYEAFSRLQNISVFTLNKKN